MSNRVARSNVVYKVRVFYSYSHKDEAMRETLETHLAIMKRQGLIEEWHDRRIMPGDKWESEISSNIGSADIVLLLVSSDFIASDYCYGIEMQRALERHEGGRTKVIPIIIRPVDWQESPIGQLQALPKDAVPITSWLNQDEAWLDVAKGVRRVIEGISTEKLASRASTESSSLRDLVKQELGRLEARIRTKQTVGGLPTGFVELDALTDGIHTNDVILVAGGPLMGKSDFVLNIAAYLAITQEAGVVFFSLRLPLDNVTRRILAVESEISPTSILRGELKDEEVLRLVKAGGILSSSTIFFEGGPAVGQREIEEAVDRARAGRQLGAVIIDGIEHVVSEGGRRRNDGPASAMKMLRIIGRKHRLPMILTLTLPSPKPNRIDKRPKIADIDDWEHVAGDLANVVILLYRDIVYNAASLMPFIADVIVARNEHGSVGTVQLAYRERYGAFANVYLE
jgi:replicative DNA helicase